MLTNNEMWMLFDPNILHRQNFQLERNDSLLLNTQIKGSCQNKIHVHWNITVFAQAFKDYLHICVL